MPDNPKPLTRICLIKFPPFINWCWVVINNFTQILKVHTLSKQCQTLSDEHSAASNLGLKCLPMSLKKDDRLIWVNSLRQGIFLHAFLSFAAFLQNQLFRKILSGMSNRWDPDQAPLFVCKGYEQMTLIGIELRCINR